MEEFEMKKSMLFFTVMAMAAMLFAGCASTGNTRQNGPALNRDIANEIFDSIPWDEDGWIVSDYSYPDEILKAFYDKGFRYFNYSETTDPLPIDYWHTSDFDQYYYYNDEWSFGDTYIRINGENDYVDKNGNFVEILVSLTFVRTADDYTHFVWDNYRTIWNSYEFFREGSYYERKERP
jgi:hypothetical protein